MEWINNLWYLWLIIGIILIVLEIFTPGFVVALIGFACLITGILAILIHNIYFQLVFFVISLTLLMIFIRPILLKYLKLTKDHKSNVFALIGKEAIVETEIDNLKGTGYIKIGADYWKAKSSDGSIIPKDSIVIIEKMEGITATVSLKK
ncbi:MAG TPA: NfeD family protein [Spirochaetota bacterium]|nr:NfeD family protein [Spirochaetota bacterium]HOL56204.1 NfeD family protein [Spirochaetota bacterium]HPP03821.1 NfeD family protein [Spirochaetota bacterium]